MFSTTIIPTVGRSTLERAVTSVLTQHLPGEEFEVIVVNDSGRPLPAAAWQTAPQVHIIHTNRRERSVARNTGAAVAQGRYLHFLDDDDWLMPGALSHLHALSRTTPDAWLYGATQLVDRQDQPLIKLQPEWQGNCFLPALAGEWIPLQASLIDATAFFSVGGFNPHISGPEDVDLLRRLALRHDVAGTAATVVNIRWGRQGSTTDRTSHPTQSRWARERVLDMPGVFPRLRPQAVSAGWHGRVARIYLTSLIWNLRRGRFLTAAGRGVLVLRALLLAGPHFVLSGDLWHSILRPYSSETFEAGLQQAGLQS